MGNRGTQFVIAGSGAGGATVARELSRAGKKVLVVERGEREKKLGTFLDSLRFYDANRITKMPRKSKEGVILWRTFMAGGTTVVAMANIVRCLQEELGDLGIDLETDFIEAEKEIGNAPLPDQKLSPGGLRVCEAARELGYKMVKMPKCIDPEKCKSCGHCSLGCARDAKWTALRHLDEAQQLGAEILYKTSLERVISEGGKVSAVLINGPEGRREIRAGVVILSAGGLGTPVILQNSGIAEAGSGLFIDILVNTYGITEDYNQANEPEMSLVDLEFQKEKGFILSSYIQHPREVRLIELGMTGYSMPVNRMIGMMTKIADDASGTVYKNGLISKAVTPSDQKKIDEGTQISKEILIKAGAKPKSIVYTKPGGAHPGGTASIGKVVDSRLMTRVKNLYVCDASVLPKAPGLPPILTIVALGKHLAKHLAES